MDDSRTGSDIDDPRPLIFGRRQPSCMFGPEDKTREAMQLHVKFRLSGIRFCFTSLIYFGLGYFAYSDRLDLLRGVCLLAFFFLNPGFALVMRATALRSIKPVTGILEGDVPLPLSDADAAHLLKSVARVPWNMAVAAMDCWVVLVPTGFYVVERFTPGIRHSLFELFVLGAMSMPALGMAEALRLELFLRPFGLKFIPDHILRTVKSPLLFNLRKRILISTALLGPYLVVVFIVLSYMRLSTCGTIAEAQQRLLPLAIYFALTAALAALVLSHYFLDVINRPLQQIMNVLQDKDAEMQPASLDEFGVVSGLIRERRQLEMAKQQFVAMVSHELPTPLMSLKGFLTVMLKGGYGELAPQLQQKGTLAQRSVHRLIKLINDILDAEKLEAGKFECRFGATSSSTVVNRAVESLKDLAAESGADVQVKCDELELWGDEDRLVQVLVNLISNAIKHCNGSPVLVTAADGEGFVEFGVKDEGDGIDASQQTAIFERFRQITTNGAGKTGNNGSNGTGLGLPIAKTLVEQHSGTIGVESVPGSGSYFWFRLPKRRCDSH